MEESKIIASAPSSQGREDVGIQNSPHQSYPSVEDSVQEVALDLRVQKSSHMDTKDGSASCDSPMTPSSKYPHLHSDKRHRSSEEG